MVDQNLLGSKSSDARYITYFYRIVNIKCGLLRNVFCVALRFVCSSESVEILIVAFPSEHGRCHGTSKRANYANQDLG